MEKPRLPIIGGGALLTDLWFAKRWYAPALGVSQATIQAALGAFFLGIVLIWTWFAFVRPPTFGRTNARRFARTAYWMLVRGSDRELAVLAAELAVSGRFLVRHAAGRERGRRHFSRHMAQHLRRWMEAHGNLLKFARLPSGVSKAPRPPKPTTQDYARDVLLLIANRKICRQIAAASPVTAIAIMDEASRNVGRQLPLNQFSTILNTEVVRNPDSIIYHEDGVYSGGLGRLQPYSKTVYGDFRLVNDIDGLDIDYRLAHDFSAEQYEAYCHILSLAVKSCIDLRMHLQHSYTLYRAFGNLKTGLLDLSHINGREDYSDAPGYRKLWTASHFCRDIIEYLEQSADIEVVGVKRPKHFAPVDIYELIADLVFGMIERAAWVTGPSWTSWETQHNSLWSTLFGLGRNGRIAELILRKVERKAFESISEFDKYPHYGSARILGYFLNIFGFGEPRADRKQPAEALRRYVLRWTQINYLQLRRDFPGVADACLQGSITFDESNGRLIKSFRTSMDGTVPQHYLQLQPLRPVVAA